MIRRTCSVGLRRVLGVAWLLVSAVVPASAGDVQLRWDANTEPDLAGYIVLYGTQSGVYTHSREVAAGSAATVIEGLADGATYYFVVRAINTAGLQSGMSNEAAVTLAPTSLPAPTVAAVSPTSGPTTGGTLVTVTGTNFQSGAVVRFGSTVATVQSVTATSLAVTAPARAAGTVAVSVTNPDGQAASKSSAYTYTTPVAPAPTITGLTPTSGSSAGGTTMTIAGTNFVSGATVRFGTQTATVASGSSTALVVTTPPLTPGAFPVTVTLPDGQNVTAAQSYTALAVTPVVSAVGPAWGPTTGGTTVTITGNQFQPGATVLFGTTTGLVQSVSATLIAVVAPAHVAGSVDVTVVNPGGAATTRSAAFLYQALPPTLSGVTPSRGTVDGGTSVVVAGAHFAAGATVTFDGVAGIVTAVTPTTITVQTPARPAGPVTVTVRHPDGQSASLPGGYSYDPAAPSIAALTPDRGPVAGGSAVLITGAHFAVGAFVSIGGVPAAVTGVASTALQVITPAGGPGAADVLIRNPDGLEARLAGGYTYEEDEPTEPRRFVRYFAEGVRGAFFDTRFALANPHPSAASVTVTFTDPLGIETSMALVVPAGGYAAIDRDNMPALSNEAFATRVESDLEIAVDRTVQWDATGYGAHSETGIAAPRTTWYFAEGATHSGFEVFYLLQNPGPLRAEVLVRYLLGTGEVVEKLHVVAPFARTNVWVNQDDARLRGAEISAVLTSINDVPIVAERSMYQSVGHQLFTAGHNSAGIAAPATDWFLAEGATGEYFDMFMLVGNPGATAAELDVTYLRAVGAPIHRHYTVAPNSRFTIWVDHEDPALAAADVSVIVRATNAVPVIVERTMWWPATRGGRWTEAHNSAGATTTAPRWVLADGVSSDATGAVTYALVANTSAAPTTVRFTLLTPAGRGPAADVAVAGNRRFSIDVAQAFPEARNQRFGLLVESLDAAPLVVERASYWNAGGVPWAAGTDSLATPLTTKVDLDITDR